MSEIVQAADFELVQTWLHETFFPAPGAGLPRFPVSFWNGNIGSQLGVESLFMDREPARSEDGFCVETVVLVDSHSGLEVRCEIKIFKDFPAVEWVAYVANAGEEDTSVLSDIRPLDTLFPLDPGASCRVHHARGALSRTNDFEPLETPLTLRQGGSRLELSATTGKSSTLHLPFFNLELGNSGVIGAIGWSGGWSASFSRQRDGVRVRAGMERTHLRLHPGEEIRTPRILLLFWQAGETFDGSHDGTRDRIRSHNMFRRLILAHYTPRLRGDVVQPPFCEGVWGARSEESHLEKIRWLNENGIPTECYWIDAGWYGDRPLAEAADGLGSGWMRQVGTWSPNAEAYPRGLAPIGAAAEAAGLGFVLWVEPERAFEGTQLVREHPEWLIGPVPSGNTDGDNFMVNLGIPEARRYITDLVSGLIDGSGITCYRQDFNDLRVPELMQMADPPDRVGMTEIRHITGLYAFWDELLARHPGLIIDNCAGGGQRIDLETIARSVPLWRSDLQCWPFDPMAMQTQTQGLAPWVPLSAAVCEAASTYAMRSALGPAVVTHWSSQALDAGVDLPVEAIRELMTEALALRKYFCGDFYPLLAFNLAADAWAAWQFDRPDLGEGMVVAFRRHASPFPRWEARLQALDEAAEYELVSWDDQSTRRVTGGTLLTEGFLVSLGEKPGAVLFTYRRISHERARPARQP